MMKDRKISFSNWGLRYRCIRTARRIERIRTREKRLRNKLSGMEGEAAWQLLWQIRELHVRADLLEARYARLADGAEHPERLAI